MIDPELKTELDQINQNLILLKNKPGGGVWRAFFNGFFNTLGRILMWVIVLVICFWILQKTGWWDAFVKQAQTFSDVLNSAKNLTAPSSSSASGAGHSTTITLPNGQKYQVNIPQ